MNLACSGAISRPRMSYFSLASTTIERPSGVSSESEPSWAASARSRWSPPATGTHSAAWGLAVWWAWHGSWGARVVEGGAREGEKVEAPQPVHAGDADRRQQGADRRR